MKRTLQGLRILNTRPKDQAQLLSREISALNGTVIECPTIEIQPVNNNWIHSLPNLMNVHHAIFVSANAVHYCFHELKENNIPWPTQINVIAIGQGSANALNERGIRVHEIPEISDSEHLLDLNSLKLINKKIVLLFKGEGGRTLIEENLHKKGANVLIQWVYKRKLPTISPELITSIWRDDLVDIILFTSEQSLHNLFMMFGKEAQDWLINKPCLVLSERLAKSASLMGIKKIIISHPDQLMDTLFNYYQGLFHGQ